MQITKPPETNKGKKSGLSFAGSLNFNVLGAEKALRVYETLFAGPKDDTEYLSSSDESIAFDSEDDAKPAAVRENDKDGEEAAAPNATANPGGDANEEATAKSAEKTSGTSKGGDAPTATAKPGGDAGGMATKNATEETATEMTAGEEMAGSSGPEGGDAPPGKNAAAPTATATAKIGGDAGEKATKNTAEETGAEKTAAEETAGSSGTQEGGDVPEKGNATELSGGTEAENAEPVYKTLTQEDLAIFDDDLTERDTHPVGDDGTEAKKGSIDDSSSDDSQDGKPLVQLKGSSDEPPSKKPRTNSDPASTETVTNVEPSSKKRRRKTTGAEVDFGLEKRETASKKRRVEEQQGAVPVHGRGDGSTVASRGRGKAGDSHGRAKTVASQGRGRGRGRGRAKR